MTSDALNARRENLRQNLDEQYENRWSKTASRDIPVTEGTLLWSKYLTEDAKRNEELNEEHLNTQIAQIQLARSITRISPASSVRYAIESLAGTGFSRHVQFLAHVRRYANEFSMFLIETDRADPESPTCTWAQRRGHHKNPSVLSQSRNLKIALVFSGGLYRCSYGHSVTITIFL